MNILITSSGDNINAVFDKRFARAAYYCLYNTKSKQSNFIKNEIKELGNAGKKAAEKMMELNVSKVISGDFGTTAKLALDKLDIQMIILPDTEQSIAQIINKIK